MYFFAHKVVGTMDVDGLAEVVPNRQLMGWIEYHKQFPFGDDWEQTASTIAAVLTPHTKQKLTAEKFIPRRRKRKQSAAEITAQMDQFRAQYRG